MEKKAQQKCHLNIETVRKDKEMTWEERMNFLMPKMMIGIGKDLYEVVEDEDQEKKSNNKANLQGLEIKKSLEVTPEKKTSRKNSAPLKKRWNKEQPLTSTALYITQTDLLESTPDVSSIHNSGERCNERPLLSNPIQLTVSRPVTKFNHLTSTPNCSRKEQLEMDLSAIQPLLQDDELDIHASTMVNSMEIVPLHDSVDLPPPLDAEHVLALNKKSDEKDSDKAKVTQGHIKRTVANVQTKHREIFKFKTKVSEIVHKAMEIAKVNEKRGTESDDGRFDDEGDVLESSVKAQEKTSLYGKHKISDNACDKLNVLEYDEEHDIEKKAENNSAVLSNNDESSHNLNESKQRRLSFKDLSIHKEFDFEAENNEIMNESADCHMPNDSVQSRCNVQSKQENYSRNRNRRKKESGISNEFRSEQQNIHDKIGTENEKRSDFSKNRLVRSSSFLGKVHSSKLNKIRKRLDDVKRSVPEDSLCSWKSFLKKRSVVKKHVFYGPVDSSKAVVDDILKNFLSVTC
ncbi:uncharacterized protein LOC133182030 [Saccostrea echinata]|uniref:uncharacterized protein LOC133182030 n=1 Tax=Saccostrea echinata TaxID=191078 RepID=UPI002A8159D5|nr:uncharacterized protein LOC133182030 [Saccostrea echinata]